MKQLSGYFRSSALFYNYYIIYNMSLIIYIQFTTANQLQQFLSSCLPVNTSPDM